MRIDLLTREYPPHVYGGAGVHVTELSRALAPLADVHVRSFDGDRTPEEQAAIPEGVSFSGYTAPGSLAEANGALQALGTDLTMVEDIAGADIVHSHTWYANMAGHLVHLYHGIPHVISAHSLEPLRPWKREQLGGGYELSSWVEKTAYEAANGIVAVSRAMRADTLRVYPNIDPGRVRVIHNGVDLDAWARPESEAEWEAARRTFHELTGLDPEKRTIIFVGRITRQKGVPGLLRALHYVDADVQVVLLAGAPDTPEIAEETRGLVEDLQRERPGVVWIEEHLPHEQIVALESCSTTFVTPSIYEPLGIVNLEAMAAGLPVVGTDTGGIPDCIVDGETGFLVPIEQEQDGSGTPLDPERFERDLGERLQAMVDDPERAAEMGRAGRKRAEEQFSWAAIARETIAFYRDLLD